MTTDEICYMSIAQLAKLMRLRKLSPVEVINAHIERIEHLKKELNTWITFVPESALYAAKQAEAQIQQGDYKGVLHGIPFGVKDVYEVSGIRTTYGCKVYDSSMSVTDSEIVVRLRDAGAILLGKLNLHCLQFGGTGENKHYGDTPNPYDRSRITGGSSSGSASAVATGQCSFALGTDAGGSVRIPAAFCGVVGLKPTFGMLSQRGIMKLSPSMDHPGPVTRTVEDCALVMSTIAGFDSMHRKSSEIELGRFANTRNEDATNCLIGVPREFFDVPIDPEVKELFHQALVILESLGAEVTEVSWPSFRFSNAAATAILLAEASDSLKKLVLTHGDDIDSLVRNRIECGLFVPAFRYIQAQRARDLITRESCEILKHVDLLAGPTLPFPAPELGKEEVIIDGAPLDLYYGLGLYTRPYNLNGQPAITMPCGLTTSGLPVGIQLSSARFGEKTVFRVARAYEKASECHRRSRPMI